MRREFLVVSALLLAGIAVGGFFFPAVWWALAIAGPLVALGVGDMLQTHQTIRRNFPVIGWGRYLMEAIRPEINQYFVESNTDGVPFSREDRSIVYQRAKGVVDTIPFGTKQDVYGVGYEWVNHSISPAHVGIENMRVTVGGPQCAQPYSASLLNISAMSYGALSKNAVLALNGAAHDGNFAHNTGEGGISAHHLKFGGDLIWQIGTGYFGCRTSDGRFLEETFQQRALLPQVKMIEVKLSQGAKPGHGGILPAEKVTKEIAAFRDVPMGLDVISPPGHTAFRSPVEMMSFIARLRELSEGKPVGFKLCIGKRREFLALCKAMRETGITPDFITVDGGEGGTGAAPAEFSNHVGTPGREALIFAHNALVGFDLRKDVRLAATGKVNTSFGIIKLLALGADFTFAARSMMLALGCIQALRCNTNECPTGVATQKARLVNGLVVPDKRRRVLAFHQGTLRTAAHLLGAMGLSGPADLRPWHIMRRCGPTDIKHYGELFQYLLPGALLTGEPPKDYARALEACTHTSFQHVDDIVPTEQLPVS